MALVLVVLVLVLVLVGGQSPGLVPQATGADRSSGLGELASFAPWCRLVLSSFAPEVPLGGSAQLRSEVWLAGSQLSL